MTDPILIAMTVFAAACLAFALWMWSFSRAAQADSEMLLDSLNESQQEILTLRQAVTELLQTRRASTRQRFLGIIEGNSGAM